MRLSIEHGLRATIAGSTAILSACGGLTVYQGDAERKGIPFYMKAPLCTQETSLLQSQLAVTFTITEVKSGKPNAQGRGAKFESATILLPDTRAARDEIEKELPPNGAQKTIAAATSDPDVIVQRLGAEITAALKAIPSNVEIEVAKNAWDTSLVVDTSTTYYINTHTPPFGTAQGQFKFAEDHTLTEASSTVTDETGKTLLSLLPIAEKLKVQWGAVADPTAVAAPAAVGAVGRPAAKKAIQVEVSRTLSPVKTVWTLRKISRGVCTPANPLRLADATPSPGNAATAQLVSKSVLTDGGGEKPEPKPSYQISGSITPPAEKPEKKK